MGKTKTEIWSGAALKLGVERIGSTTENTPQRFAMEDAYPNAVDAALEMYGWHFATKRKKLAQDSSSPEFGFDYQYPVLGDCVRVLGVWDGIAFSDDIVWTEENGFYLTDEQDFYIQYTSNDITEADFSFMFIQALEYQLASVTALKLGKYRTVMADMAALAEGWANKAMTSDAKRRSRRASKQKSSWLTARGLTTTIPPAEIL